MTCLLQSDRGELVVCSQGGLFAYRGRRFTPTGREQGLPESDAVEEVVQTPDGYVYVRYTDALYVSDRRSSAASSFEQLRFRKVSLETNFFNDGERQVASWSGGVALIDNDEIVDVGPDPGASQARALDLPTKASRRFGHLDRLFSIDGNLWFTTDRHEICRYTPEQPVCLRRSDGLPDLGWRDLTAGEGRLILARSERGIATIDPVTKQIAYAELPDQLDWPNTMKFLLRFFRDPQGRLMTQSASGLIVRTTLGWEPISFADLSGMVGITSVLADRTGTLWIGTYQRGISRVLGYGQWDSLRTAASEASGGLIWKVARGPDGHLWVATDGSLQEYDDGNDDRLVRSFGGGTYAVTVGPDGRIWTGAGSDGLRLIDPRTGQAETVSTPLATQMAVEGRRVWIGTASGLFDADVEGSSPVVLRRASSFGREVTALAADGAGGAWFTSGLTLMHVGADGRERVALDRWPGGGFQPLCMTRSGSDLWIGGSGGLFRFRVDGERVVPVHRFDATSTGDNTVVAVNADRLGRIWVGTGSGIAAFDGQRWVSADETSGLVWDDVSQDGITEDTDGTIWIATSNGLSHILHPELLFRPASPDVVLESPELDGRRLTSSSVPFNSGPLTFTLATMRYASEDSVRFRYWMSGVDADWVTAASDEVRYASVPPGRHVLTVDAEDALTHLRSAPATLTIRMGWPWWRQWWAEFGECVLAVALAIAAWWWQAARYARNQHELERLVTERTRELELRTLEIESSRRRVQDQAAMLERQAHALRLQATRDGLTGLLNRHAIERQLLEMPTGADGRRECALALIDVDHFKGINDRHGHLRGDQVLRDTARRIAGALGPNDATGRYGGEEFVVLLDDRDARAAERLIRLHERIRGENFLLGEVSERVTVSIGLAWLREGDEWESVVGRADQALYAAKRAGRDRIVEEETPRPAAPDRRPGVERSAG